jgi:hypothetical protein
MGMPPDCGIIQGNAGHGMAVPTSPTACKEASSLSKFSTPRRHSGTGFNVEDEVVDEVLQNDLGAALDPQMARQFDPDTIEHIETILLPAYIKAGDVEKAALCEKVLAKYGRAVPNHVSGLWSPLDVPRNELQVRELFAARLPEFGYRLVASQAAFPDWLLVSDEGKFVYTEVEHRSSGFNLHRHDPGMCDLIVCWEHDWPESPLPVLEFFSGRLFETEQPARGKARGGLSINFAGTLARHYKGNSGLRREMGQPRPQSATGSRGAMILDRFDSLQLEGERRDRAAQLAAEEFGITRATVYAHARRRRKKRY